MSHGGRHLDFRGQLTRAVLIWDEHTDVDESAVESHRLEVIPLVLVCHCSIFLSLINLFVLSSAEYSLLNHGGEDST